MLAIPAELPRRLGINVGDTAIVAVVDGERHVESLASTLDDARRIMRQLVPEGVSLANELIVDRRAESRGDWTWPRNASWTPPLSSSRFNDEPGEERVRQALGTAIVSAVDVSEVVAKIV